MLRPAEGAAECGVIEFERETLREMRERLDARFGTRVPTKESRWMRVTMSRVMLAVWVARVVAEGRQVVSLSVSGEMRVIRCDR